MRARTFGIIFDTLSLGVVCLLLTILASEMHSTWRLIAISTLVLAMVAMFVVWAKYQRTTFRQATDCRYLAMVDRINITSRDPWPRSAQLLERHVFGGQVVKK
jgi:hypothetical protein